MLAVGAVRAGCSSNPENLLIFTISVTLLILLDTAANSVHVVQFRVHRIA